MKGQYTYTVDRKVVTKHRRVKSKAANYYAPHREPAQRRAWVETATIELTIDVDGLARELAVRAIHTMGGKSGALGGLIKAKVIKRVEAHVRVEDVPMDDGYELVGEA